MNFEGYDALRNGTAWLDLSARGKVYATGRDRARLLHNLTTNNVKQLAPGEGCYAFLLTPQGRIQADLHIFCLEDRFLLDTEPETRERVQQLIRKYIIADDVTLTDASDALCEVTLEGPGSAAVLAASGAPAPAKPWAHAPWDGMLVAAGAAPASAEAARVVRLENGVPRYGEDIFETTLPQETRQMHALHFNKGCYLGQEIVERIRARGHVNRLLMKLLVEGVEPPVPGARVEAEGAEAGEITSAAYSPAAGKVAALAYLRAQYARAGAALSVTGRPAVVG